MEVHRIEPQECYDWLQRKHYAQRVPSIVFAFGLFKQNWPIGIITYGIPANNNLNEIAGFRAIELNRLCINDDAPKNSASRLIGGSLRMLPPPYVVISYADAGQGHVGYVYQATNWMYCGMGSGDTEFEKDGKKYHRKALFNVFGTGSKAALIAEGYKPVAVEAKHRYVYFVGDRRQKQKNAEATGMAAISVSKRRNEKV